jgi:hypothetical protein
MGQRRHDDDVDVAVDERRVAGEIDDAVVVGAALELAVILDGVAGDEHALPRARHRLAAGAVLGVEQRLQPREPRLLHRLGHRVRQLRGWACRGGGCTGS